MLSTICRKATLAQLADLSAVAFGEGGATLLLRYCTNL